DAIETGQMQGYLLPMVLGAVQIEGQESLTVGEELDTQAQRIPAHPKAMAGRTDKAVLLHRAEGLRDDDIAPREFRPIGAAGGDRLGVLERAVAHQDADGLALPHEAADRSQELFAQA